MNANELNPNNIQARAAHILKSFGIEPGNNIIMKNIDEYDLEKGGPGSGRHKIIESWSNYSKKSGSKQKKRVVLKNASLEEAIKFIKENYPGAKLIGDNNFFQQETGLFGRHINIKSQSTKVDMEEIEIIGNTKSGKPVYNLYRHPAHREFSKEDHQEAAIFHNHKTHERLINLEDRNFHYNEAKKHFHASHKKD